MEKALKTKTKAASFCKPAKPLRDAAQIPAVATKKGLAS